MQFRDVTVVHEEALDEKILEIEVRGKRGVGYCKSMPGAVRPFERLKTRYRPPRAYEDGSHGAAKSAAAKETLEKDGDGAHAPEKGAADKRLPQPTDPIFPKWQRELFNAILDEENLRVDREGRPRTAYSLRHTYICLRLMEGADIYQIAKNCRTSVEMIEKYYAAHIKTRLDTAAINIMKPRLKEKSEPHEKPLSE